MKTQLVNLKQVTAERIPPHSQLLMVLVLLVPNSRAAIAERGPQLSETTKYLYLSPCTKTTGAYRNAHEYGYSKGRCVAGTLAEDPYAL